MSLRQIVLDTETTGLRIEDGHRIIEIGCVELIDRKITGQHFHHYLNPEREVEAGALSVHGITNQFLQDKPTFCQIVAEFVEFINGAELIIHNAPFDLGFIHHEIFLTQQSYKLLTEYCSIVDTLQMARQIHVGQRNGLDALCKRYSIDNSKRDLHGALLDANLLAHVYLAMTGGQGSFFDAINETSTTRATNKSTSVVTLKKHQLPILRATDEEVSEHLKYLALLKQVSGKCLWEGMDLTDISR